MTLIVSYSSSFTLSNTLLIFTDMFSDGLSPSFKMANRSFPSSLALRILSSESSISFKFLIFKKGGLFVLPHIAFENPLWSPSLSTAIIV